MTRFAPRLMVLLLCATALTGCAGVSATIASATGGKADDAAPKTKPVDFAGTPGDLDSSVRQAQMARAAGQYDQAVHILSQLMLVAADDPRVVGEYGKTLVEQGRASEAVQFLTRAAELSPNDWTIYSATGVANDQLGDQAAARIAYEHALALKPGEASVLNNYALSRMLANDSEGARILIGRAEMAGGASDPKIARNIAMMNQLASQAPQAVASAPQQPVATASARPAQTVQQPIVIPAPPPVASSGAPRPLVAQQAPQPTPRAQVAQQNLPPLPLAIPAPQTAPHTTPPAPSLYAPYQAVVMQRVPVDPLAGPATLASHTPRLRAATRVADTTGPDAKGVAVGKPVIAKAAAAHVADASAPDAKGVAIGKPVIAGGAKTATAPSTPGKAADAKSAKAKNAVPALRMTADARSP